MMKRDSSTNTSPSPYDEIADWYDESIQRGALIQNLVAPSLLELAGDVQDKRVLDLACGQGHVTRALAEAGASVLGVDTSAGLLRIAQEYEANAPLGITYRQDDAQTLESVRDESFDGVTCNMALMDIPDLEATFRSVWRVLHRGGWVVFSITHPCFLTPESGWVLKNGREGRYVYAYFEETYWRSDNPDGVRGKVGAYHRTLSTYLNALASVGFSLQRVEEPRPKGEIAERIGGYATVPAVLAVRASKLER